MIYYKKSVQRKISVKYNNPILFQLSLLQHNKKWYSNIQIFTDLVLTFEILIIMY